MISTHKNKEDDIYVEQEEAETNYLMNTKHEGGEDEDDL